MVAKRTVHQMPPFLELSLRGSSLASQSLLILVFFYILQGFFESLYSHISMKLPHVFVEYHKIFFKLILFFKKFVAFHTISPTPSKEPLKILHFQVHSHM